MSSTSDRSAIPFSFDYPSGSTYASSSATTYTGVAADVLEPVVGTSVSVIDRDLGIPTTVYQSEIGSAAYTHLVTDSMGNVPGWLESGSYKLTAASQGSFTGAIVSFEAVRGDGVTRIAPGAVVQTSFALGAVDFPQLDPAIIALLDEIPALQAALAALQGTPNGSSFPLGSLVVYPVPEEAFEAGLHYDNPESLSTDPGYLRWYPDILQIPTGFLPAGGQIELISAYPALYEYLQFYFNEVGFDESLGTPPSGYFFVPEEPFSFLTGPGNPADYANMGSQAAYYASQNPVLSQYYPLPIIKY